MKTFWRNVLYVGSAVLLGGLLGLSSLAYGSWAQRPLAVAPRYITMSPGTPTKKTTVGAAETNITLSETNACVRVSCDVASEYLVGVSSAPPTAASGTGNQIPAGAVERFCLTGTQNYISFYTSAAGHCWIAEVSP